MVNSNTVSVVTSVPPPPPGMGTLIVDTTPVKGEVFIDAVSQGKAPIVVNVAAGSHVVSFGPVSVAYTTPRPQTMDVAEGDIVPVMGIYVLTNIPSWLPYALLGGGAAVLVASLAARGKKK